MVLPIRRAVVVGVSDNSVKVAFADRPKESVTVPYPVLWAGPGAQSISAGVAIGTWVLCAELTAGEWNIVGTTKIPSFFKGSILDKVSSAVAGSLTYEKLDPGEFSIKTAWGSLLLFDNKGDIRIENGADNHVVFNKEKQNYVNTFSNRVSLSEGRMLVEGIVKRDLRPSETPGESEIFNKITDSESDDFLTVTCRDSFLSPSIKTDKHSDSTTTFRNPPFIEVREKIFEYADSFGVADTQLECDRILNPDTHIGQDKTHRSRNKTSLLNLNLDNPNDLMEIVKGSLIDVYGVPIDINYRQILAKSYLGSGDLCKTFLDSNKLLSRNVAYHFEINTKKPNWVGREDKEKNNKAANSQIRSKFSVDIDKTGLTKINIPSSPEYGNIPLLTRHTSSNERNPDQVDAVLEQIGAKDKESDAKKRSASSTSENGGDFFGVAIEDSTYGGSGRSTEKGLVLNTAHHNLLKTSTNIVNTLDKFGMEDLIRGDALYDIKDAFLPENNKVSSGSDPVLGSKINNNINDESANAGGRSLHTNFDGSWELSVGADTLDRKSLLLDCAGGVVNMIGRNRLGRSITTSADGDVMLDIGGYGIDEGDRFKEEVNGETKNDRGEYRAGELVIRVAGIEKDGSQDSYIKIDKNGITISSNATHDEAIGIALLSKGPITIQSGSVLKLAGSQIINAQGTNSRPMSAGNRPI